MNKEAESNKLNYFNLSIEKAFYREKIDHLPDIKKNERKQFNKAIKKIDKQLDKITIEKPDRDRIDAYFMTNHASYIEHTLFNMEQESLELTFSQFEKELKKVDEEQKMYEKDFNKYLNRESVSETVYDEKNEVISLYSKFLKGESLTYEERHTIVNYDKENDAFEQMQYRLEAIDTVREENSEIDLTTQEEALCATRGEQQAMADIIAVEYYQQSINEKQEQKKEEKEKKEEKKNEKTATRQLMM